MKDKDKDKDKFILSSIKDIYIRQLPLSINDLPNGTIETKKKNTKSK